VVQTGYGQSDPVDRFIRLQIRKELILVNLISFNEKLKSIYYEICKTTYVAKNNF